MFKSLIVLAFLSTALSGCLENNGQRALAGAAIGAGLAGVTGNDPATGGLIGLGAGALCRDARVC